MKLIIVLMMAVVASATAQQVQQKFQFGRVTTESAMLPGSTKPWIKLIAPYETSAEWTDGLAFNFYAIVKSEGSSGRERLLVGSIAYANIPAGKHLAMMYLPPGVVARFGAPSAVKVECFQSDEQLGVTGLNGVGAESRAFERPELRITDGMLLPVRATPWIQLDFDKTPDLYAPY